MKKVKLFAEQFQSAIIGLLQEHNDQPLTEKRIAEKLAVRGGDRKRLGKILNAMVREGLIVRVHQNHYGLGSPADLVTGELEVRRSGDGVVAPKDGGEEVFVARDDLGTALPRDLVVARLIKDSVKVKWGLRRAGKVIRILERSLGNIVGTLRSSGKFFYVVPIDPVYARDFYVPGPKNARVNDRVVVQFTAWVNRHVNPEAEITEVIGPENNPSHDTTVIIRQYALPDHFKPEVLREADQSAELLNQPGARQDFRGKYILTIDPATARDYDDAISLETDKNGNRILGVHIADVSHFVQPNSALDREARRRGNSVYFPDLVLPMLPEVISNGLCSLRPDEDKFTFSVLMTFDSAGVPLKADFCRSVIRSRLRLTYEQALGVLKSPASHHPRVNRISPEKDGHDKTWPSTTRESSQLSTVEGRALSRPHDFCTPFPNVGPEAVRLLHQSHTLAQQLRRRRFTQCALNLDMPEYEIFMGKNGMIENIRQTISDISHQLIEECMIAANEAVDRALSERGFGLIRRVHEPPAPEKIEALAIQIGELGFHPGDLSRRKNMAAFLETLSGHPFEYDAKVAVLKSMKRAVYSPEPLGHYGLAKRYYAHFTSPIRRYPDLVVHRVLAAMLSARANPYKSGELAALGLSCSRTEQTADAAETALIEIKKYRFLEQQIARRRPEIYDAVVVCVKNFGMFVELTSLQIQGLVHVSTISKEFVRFDSRREELCAHKKKYGVGRRVQVTPVRVDFDKRQVDFVLADNERKKH